MKELFPKPDRRPNKIAPERHARIVARYRDSEETVKEIARSLGVSDRQVYRIVRRAGVKRTRWLAVEERAEIVRLYRAGGVTQAGLARRFQCSPTSVVKALNAAGVERMPIREAFKLRRYDTPTHWSKNALVLP